MTILIFNFSSSAAAYTKEEAAKFHYVEKPPDGAKGRKVFFVVGLGMPDEVLPPELERAEGEETVLENLEGDENTAPAGQEKKDSEEKKEGGSKEKEGEEKAEKEGEGKAEKEGEEKVEEEGEGKAEKEGEGKAEEEGEGKVEKEGEGKAEKEGEGKVEVIKQADRQPFKPKQFKGDLVPRPRIPKSNELPVYPDRIRIISRSRDQLYFDVEFSEPGERDGEWFGF